MKKNIIRLTEAELKQYISKVISEQAVASAVSAVVNVEAEKQKTATLRTEVGGKNVQLYLDAAKTKKSHLVNIITIGFSQRQTGVYYFTVKDLSFVTSTGGQTTPADNMGPITMLRFDCTEPNQFNAIGDGNKQLGTLYCPPFTELVKKNVACTTVNHNADFATAKPAAPAPAAAPKADIA